MQDLLNVAYQPLVDLDLIYGRLGKGPATDAVLRELNGPFLVATNTEYENSRPRIVIVGQENNGWMDDIADYLGWVGSKSIEDALAVYRGFDIATYRYGTFSRYFSLFRDRLLGETPEGGRRSILWTNLFKLNHKGKQSIYSPLLEPMLKLQEEVFAQEMNALKPDAVVFLTGPRYDHIIERFYPKVLFRAVDGHPVNEVAEVVAEGLPKLSFRTYHPGYLNRIRSKKPHCIESIIPRILAAR
jgi:hypothetical protein